MVVWRMAPRTEVVGAVVQQGASASNAASDDHRDTVFRKTYVHYQTSSVDRKVWNKLTALLTDRPCLSHELLDERVVAFLI